MDYLNFITADTLTEKLGNYVKQEDLQGYSTTQEINTEFAKISDLDQLATKSSLLDFITADSLIYYVKLDDLETKIIALDQFQRHL